MRPLWVIQRIFMWISVCPFPSDESTDNWKKRISYAFLPTAMIVQSSITIASSMFIWKNISNDLESCLDAVYPIMASMSLIFFMSMAYLQREKVNSIFHKLSNIFDARKSSEILYLTFFQICIAMN